MKGKEENTNRANLIGCKMRVLECGWKKEGGIQRHYDVMYHSANSNGKLEAEMMVHSYIFRSIWKADFFFPNRMKKIKFQLAHALFQEVVTCLI